jgi:hypothetical protein
MGRWGLMEEKVGKRKRWLIPLTAIVLVILAFASYQWIIPRTNLEVRTVYHESPSGGGTGGVINVNVLITNRGNRPVEDLDCMVIVRDLDGREKGRNMVENMGLERGQNAEIKLTIIGSQYIDYTISVDIDFETYKDSARETLEYHTYEEQMNLVFVDNIR